MKAWISQKTTQVKKHGTKKASWYVGWFDLDGKKHCRSFGPGSIGKREAFRYQQTLQAELVSGAYQSPARKTWEEFRQEYEEKILAGQQPETRRVAQDALKHFERIVAPRKVGTVRTQTIDQFRATRRAEKGKRKGDTVSPATVNKELRHLRAALRKARKWHYLPEVPDFTFEREPVKLPSYVTPEHFAAIYRACEKNTREPSGLPYSPADWWRGLLIMAYMTGWRIGELLALRRDDVDLAAGTALTRAGDNKGKRDALIHLHPLVVDHLGKLTSFDPGIFPWNWKRRLLYEEFARVQEAAGIVLPCAEGHTHSRFCHVYGFHDLRRAFATMNADRLSADALQELMRHKTYLTTKKYINMARQMNPAASALYVPDLAEKKA